MQRDLAAALACRLPAGTAVPPDLEQLVAARVADACAASPELAIDPITLAIALAERVAPASDLCTALRDAHISDLLLALAIGAGNPTAIARAHAIGEADVDRLCPQYVAPGRDLDAVTDFFWSAALRPENLDRYDASVPLRQHLLIGAIGAMIRAGWSRAARPAVPPWWALFELELDFVPEQHRDRFANALKDSVFSLDSEDATFLSLHVRPDLHASAESMDRLELWKRATLGRKTLATMPSERVARARGHLLTHIEASLRAHVPPDELAAIVAQLPERIDDLFLGFFRVRAQS